MLTNPNEKIIRNTTTLTISHRSTIADTPKKKKGGKQ